MAEEQGHVREKCLAKNVVETKQLKAGRKIHIYTILTEMFVMLQVISLSVRR